MPHLWVQWDSDDDQSGNVQHIAEHGVTPAEVEEVLENPVDEDVSRSTGRPLAFGFTRAGRFLLVVYEEVDEQTVYPITAYEIAERCRS